MGSEDKEKKRKAVTTASTADPPHKKSKKSKTAVTNGTGDDQKFKLVTSSEPAAAPAAAGQGKELKKKDKTRKRAADFRTDSEHEAEGVPIKDTHLQEPSKDKSGKFKKKKSKNAELEPDVEPPPIAFAESTPAIALPTTSEPIGNVVVPPPSKKKNDHKQKSDAGHNTKLPLKSDLNTAQETAKKKRGPTASDIAAERAKKLLSTPVSEWPDKRKKRQERKTQAEGAATSLTADRINGVASNTKDENLEPVADKDALPTSLQAEGQQIAEKELEEEWESEDEPEDQGAALLAGFDSDGEDPAKDVGLEAGKSVPGLSKKANKKLKKMAKRGDKETPGTVYVGRIPHGFYEHQMREYFSQFGTITKIRLSRNRKTGKPKHYAFIEFESDEVAKIVAESMDNYLMFGHILKCKYAPQESLHPDLWKGANKRFRQIPYNKMEKRALEAPKTKEQWDKKIDREQKKREKKAELMKKMGYSYELPTLKKPQEVLERRKLESIEAQKRIEEKAAEEANAADVRAVPALVSAGIVPKDEIAVKQSRSERRKAKKDEEPEKTTADKPIGASVAVAIADTTRAPASDVVIAEEPKPAASEKREKKKEKHEKKKAQKQPDPQLNDVSAAPATIVETVVASAESLPEAVLSPDEEVTPAASAPIDVEENKKKRRQRTKRNAIAEALKAPEIVVEPVVEPVISDNPVAVEKKVEKRKSDGGSEVKSILKKPKKA